MKCSKCICTCGEEMEDVMDLRVTWECSLSKVKCKTKWCNYSTTLEEINYMPIRKD